MGEPIKAPMKYNIFMLGRFAVCPKCKGAIREITGDFLRCFDCNTVFGLVDNEDEYKYLNSDKELVVYERQPIQLQVQG